MTIIQKSRLPDCKESLTGLESFVQQVKISKLAICFAKGNSL